MDLLRFVALVVVGFVACAEFGSYAFVHPVVRRLPAEHHIGVEQGLLRTFGRVMPALMPASLALGVAHAVAVTGDGAGQTAAAWAAAASLAVANVTTVIFNVPINLATGRWDPVEPPADWQATRRRWERFQAIRSWLLLAGFVLLCAAVALDAS